MEKQEHVTKLLKNFNKIWQLYSLKLFWFQGWTWANLQVKVDFIGAVLWENKY